MSRTQESLKQVGYVVLGGAVGALAGVLLAPASGRETRRRIGRRVNEEKESLIRQSHKAVESAADFLQDQLQAGKRKLSEVVNG